VLPAIAVLGGGYLAIDAVAPNADMLLGWRVLQAATSASVFYVYWPDAKIAMLTHEPRKGDFLILGITFGWIATFCQATYSIVFRLAGSPGWLMNADPVGLWLMLSVLGGILHLLAPGAIGGSVPRRNRLALGAGLGAAIALVLFLSFAKPDIRPYVDWLRPYISDWFNTGGLPHGGDAAA
jgi:drug/metabolite transporter (DMT)-like permease